MNLGKEIFEKKRRGWNSKYDHNILEKCLKRVIHESHLGDENAPMKDEDCRCKTFVVSAHLNKHAGEDEDEATILRSYDLETLQPAYAFHGKIWEAGRATSAAPTFFKPIEIEQRGESSNTSGVIAKASRRLKAETNKKDSYSDGGTVANNPCSIAVREAGKIWGFGSIGCIVSLGTGPEPKFTLDQATEQILGPRIMWLSQKLLSRFFYFRLQLAFYSLQKMTRTEHVHKETRDLVTTFINANGKNDGQVYFRFNVESENARVRLDDWEKMPQLQELAGNYMGFEDVVQKTKTIAAKLKKIRTKEQTRPRTDLQGYDYVVKLRILADSLEKVEALIDTSVKYNFVSKALVDKLKIPVHETSHTVPEIRFLKGDKVRAEHESWISFSRDGSSDHLRDRFYVLNTNPVPYELIIGSNFVEDQGSVLLKPPPLSMAAKRADEAVMKRLLEDGVDVEARDRYGSTPLFYAVANGLQHIVQLLLENGANIAAKDSRNSTPLQKAALKGHEPTVKMLLERGADTDAADVFGQTPLFAAAFAGFEAIAKLLLEKGANIEAKNAMNYTPLLNAAYEGHEAVVKLLLEKGADIEAKDQFNNTPLLNATARRHEAVVKLLLERGADTEAKDRFHNTPLINAALKGYEAIVKLLVEKRADIEAKDELDNTPLLNAASEGHEAVVKLLLENGARINARNTLYQTPLINAANQGRMAIVKLLLERGAHIDKSRLSQRGRKIISFIYIQQASRLGNQSPRNHA